MKNGKRNGTGVSKHSLRRKSTADRQHQKEVDARFLWKQVEDVVAPQLRLPVIDHLVYMHLLRHSHLEGKRRLRFSILWLSRNINLTMRPTRDAVRRLAAQGVLRLVERNSMAGHVVEVRLPDAVRGVRTKTTARAREGARKLAATDFEEVDFFKTAELRRAIHARERGRCFYCLRRVAPRSKCLDHVVPRARVGCNSYRNLVSACMECNAQKGERPAEECLRWLFREHRLGAAELKGRFEALELLAAGKLKPTPTLPSREGQGESGSLRSSVRTTPKRDSFRQGRNLRSLRSE
ncbi:MAG: HNH endonuclease signature motif containing protein [Candidatus Acidiferrum sp.]